MLTAAAVAIPAEASLPSRIWLGVERIAIACDFSGPLSETDKASLCSEFAEAARGMTDYPVALASGPAQPFGRESELVLRLSVAAEEARPAAIGVAIRPERHGLSRQSGRQTRALPVALSWQGDRPRLAGPVDPLAFFLSPPERERPMPGVLSRR